MKKLILILFLFISSANLSAQSPVWSGISRITSGYKDNNPSFSTFEGFFYLTVRDYCVFERTSGTTTQICAVRFNPSGPDTAVYYLTTNSNQKKNPVIAQNIYPYGTTGDNINSMAVWQELRNGKWDIMGSIIKNVTAWSTPFVIDSSAGDKTSPSVAVRTANEFRIAYVKNRDIYFLAINGVTLTVSNNFQITNSTGEIYSNPVIDANNTGNHLLAYSSSANNLYSNTINSSTFTVSAPRLIEAGTGSWIPSGARHSWQGIVSVYCKNGMIKSVAGTNAPVIFVSDSTKKYNCAQFYLFPIITDEALYYHFFSFNQTSNDTTKLIMLSSGPTSKDTVYIGDSTASRKTAMSYAMAQFNYEKVYCVYSKDSAGQRNLYCVSGQVIGTGLHDGSENIADNFSLYQNYPNPFNPVTNIDFSIPGSSFISLIVYDLSGKEVKRIFDNESFNAGNYHATFIGNELSSGVYFYSLIANGVSIETKRMVLLK